MSGDDNAVGKNLVPRWDGTANTYALYKEQFEAVAIYSGCPDVLDESAMRTMPTKREYDAIKYRDTSTSAWSDDEKRLMGLWEQNRKCSSLYTMGQTTNHGAMVLKVTKDEVNYPHGKVYEAFRTLDKKNKPKDTTAEIECENELEALTFSRADVYFTDVVDVCAKYEQNLTDTAKLKYLAKKCTSPTYAVIVNRELKDANPDFEKACDEIAELQRLVKANSKTVEKKSSSGKEVALNQVGGGGGSGKKCDFCNGAHKRKDCHKRNDALKKQGKCPECGKDGHLEKECWKKNPSKAPKWWNRDGDRNGKSGGGGGETSTTSVEIVVPSIEQDFF